MSLYAANTLIYTNNLLSQALYEYNIIDIIVVHACVHFYLFIVCAMVSITANSGRARECTEKKKNKQEGNG